jgi:hypothetical protein
VRWMSCGVSPDWAAAHGGAEGKAKKTTDATNDSPSSAAANL